VSRLRSEESILSYVPEVEQRGWRTWTRTKYQRRRDRVRLQSPRESLLEECPIKLSSVVSDLLGAQWPTDSARHRSWGNGSGTAQRIGRSTVAGDG
jgi:hypothetical protein